MRHRKKTFKINKHGEHRKSMIANMVCSLLKEERIMTTPKRAKFARSLAEKMITLGKDGTLAARRRAIATMRQKDVVSKVFTDLAVRFATRPGGYTRIIHLGQRQGDAAEMCYVEVLAADAAPVAEEAKTEAVKA